MADPLGPANTGHMDRRARLAAGGGTQQRDAHIQSDGPSPDYATVVEHFTPMSDCCVTGA